MLEIICIVLIFSGIPIGIGFFKLLEIREYNKNQAALRKCYSTWKEGDLLVCSQLDDCGVCDESSTFVAMIKEIKLTKVFTTPFRITDTNCLVILYNLKDNIYYTVFARPSFYGEHSYILSEDKDNALSNNDVYIFYLDTKRLIVKEILKENN